MNRTSFRFILFTVCVLLVLALVGGRLNQRSEAARRNCALLIIETAALPVGTVNQPYSAVLESDGGSGPYTFSKLTGTLPNGVTINANGTFSGTPTQPGTFTLTVQTQDANGCTGTQEFTLTINCQTINVIAPANNSTLVNTPFSAQFTQTSGAGTTTFSTVSTLPNGVTLAPSGTLSGTPMQNGSFPLVVTATDSNGCTGTVNYTLIISVCPTITLPSLPNGLAGTVYQQSLAPMVQGSYIFSLTSGNLPPGLTLANDVISGTPTQTGAFSFRITATDGNLCSGFHDYQLSITCPNILLSSTPLANGNVGASYSQALTATPAGGNYSFAVAAGSLPPGLTLSDNGVISGTPSLNGIFNFRVTAAGVGGCSGFAEYQINVAGCATIAFTPATLPNGFAGTAYNQSLSATPAGSYGFSVTSGALPMGLTLNGATGAITGTPLTQGTFNFRITASLGGCTGFRDYTLTIACPPITLSTALPNGSAGASYSQTISVTPAGTYSFSVISGSLPPGLTLTASTGVLSGLALTSGTFNFTIKAMAANGCAGTQQFLLAINCPAIALSALAPPTLGTAYNQTLTATPAGSGYSFAVSAGELPSGLSLNPATGSISGTPTAAGTFNFTIIATGFGNCSGSRTYNFTLSGGQCPSIELPGLPNGAPAQLYNNSVTASPAGNYSYMVTAGSLPPGVTLFGTLGLLFGFPNTAGTYHFTITATDSGNCLGSRNYNLVIVGAAIRPLVFGDFDGDGKTDLSVWRSQAGDWLTVNSGDGTLKSEVWGTSAAPYFDAMTPGDYDGDGKMDLAVFRRGIQNGQNGQGGQWLIKGSRDRAVISKVWGLATDAPVPGDYDGDGRTDIAVWRGAETNWYILRSSDGQTETVSWGISVAPHRDVPVAADYDGDGKTDVAVFRQSNGHWYIRLSSDGSVLDKAWGLGSDVPVVADYDGDGKADLAVWRGALGHWYIQRSSDGAVQTVSCGMSSLGDWAVPGDYDGDGKADPAVWRAVEGHWYVRQSRDDKVRSFSHGQRGDQPITAKRTP